MEHATIQVGSVARPRKRWRLQIPLWLLMLFVPFATLAVAVCFQDAQVRRDHAADVAALQGGWRLEQRGHGGVTRDSDDMSLTVYGNTLRFDRTAGKGRCYAMYTIKPERFPKAISLSFSNAVRGQGVYSIDGDTLTLCFTMRGIPRARTIRTTAGDGKLLLVFRRK